MGVRPLPLVPPALLAVLGTAQLLRDHGLWYDELYTVAVVTQPVGDIVAMVVDGRGPTAALTDPPSFNGPYYLLAALWTRLPLVGADALGLRSLSLLAAVAAIAVLGHAVELLLGRRVALLAGGLAATAPLLLTQAVEARPYGLALLATSLTLLGLARWLTGGGLALFAIAGTAMGLLHWFALPALAGLALGAALARRRWAPLLVAAVASLPTLGLVGLALARGAEGGGYLSTTGLLVPWRALLAWTGGWPLLIATALAVAVGLRRIAVPAGDRSAAARPADAARLRWLWWAWLGVPVVVVTLADLVRPVFVPRYLLPGLLALAVLAALGAARHRGLAVLLVAGTVLADASVLTRDRWERADQVVAFLLTEQQAGEPVVAVEGRSAAGLQHYAGGTRLAPDVRLPPDDPPAGATRVWLVRQLREDGTIRASDDDALLMAAGLQVVRTELFRAVKTDLVVQLWARA